LKKSATDLVTDLETKAENLRITFVTSGKTKDRDLWKEKEAELYSAYDKVGDVLPEFTRVDKLNTKLTSDLAVAKKAYDNALRNKDATDR
jgi:hypothetical protein